MVDRDVFRRRLGALETILGDLRRLMRHGRDELLADRGLKAQAERWAHLAIECALDLAHHVIADQGWSSPTTNREAFLVLHDHGVLDTDLADQMAAWAGLRNILVHMYLEVDHRLLYQILDGELDQLERFARAVAALGEPAEGGGSGR